MNDGSLYYAGDQAKIAGYKLERLNAAMDLNNLLLMYEKDLITKEELTSSKIFIDEKEELLKVPKKGIIEKLLG